MNKDGRWPERVMVSISVKTRERLEDIADRRMETISSVVRRAIERYLDSGEE